MHAFGDANWYLPKWLDRVLPHVSIDPPDSEDFFDHRSRPGRRHTLDPEVHKGSFFSRYQDLDLGAGAINWGDHPFFTLALQ